LEGEEEVIEQVIGEGDVVVVVAHPKKPHQQVFLNDVTQSDQGRESQGDEEEGEPQPAFGVVEIEEEVDGERLQEEGEKTREQDGRIALEPPRHLVGEGIVAEVEPEIEEDVVGGEANGEEGRTQVHGHRRKRKDNSNYRWL